MAKAAAWPAFAKAVATWVPPQARTLAIGVCNSGSSLGAMIAPPLVAWITIALRLALRVHRHRGSRAASGWRRSRSSETASRDGAQPSARRRRPATGCAGWISSATARPGPPFVCRFLADPLWYFYVFWIPEFLTRERGLNLAAIGAVAWIPFLVADLSNFAGGYVSLRLQRAGWTANRTRKTMMVIATVLSPVGILAVFAHSLFWTIGLISIAIFFWMWWSIAVHSLPGDYFPPRAVGSVYGIAGTGSTVGSVISTWAVGRTLDVTHSYAPVFIGIGLLMPIALVAGFALMRKVEPGRPAGLTRRPDRGGLESRHVDPEIAKLAKALPLPWRSRLLLTRRGESARRCRGSEAADHIPGNGHHLVGEALAPGCIAKSHPLREHERADAGGESERQSTGPRRRERVVGAVADDIAGERGTVEC